MQIQFPTPKEIPLEWQQTVSYAEAVPNQYSSGFRTWADPANTL